VPTGLLLGALRFYCFLAVSGRVSSGSLGYCCGGSVAVALVSEIFSWMWVVSFRDFLLPPCDSLGGRCECEFNEACNCWSCVRNVSIRFVSRDKPGELVSTIFIRRGRWGVGYGGFIESCGLLRSFAGGPFSCFCLRGLLLTVLKRVGWGNHPPGRLPNSCQ